MKKITRIVIFSAISLHVTSLIIKGFVVKSDMRMFLLAVLILATVYYIILPLSKLVLLPLNILTAGLMSVVVYILLFNYVINYFGFIKLTPWVFEGFDAYLVHIPSVMFSYIGTLIASSILYSTIINALEVVV